jgi:hypothetical protein
MDVLGVNTAKTGNQAISMFALARRLGLAGLAATAALALPSAASAAGCPPQPLERTFLPWVDPAWYQLAPDGGLEAGAAGWTLDGGAAVAGGNEPYFVGSGDDERSLALPTGAAATTAATCIGVEHPTIRFFARNAGSPDAALAVSVVFRDPSGRRQSLPIGTVRAGSEWTPTPVLPVAVNLLSLVGDQQAAFRFTPADARGAWSIDDIYVDPYRKG